MKYTTVFVLILFHLTICPISSKGQGFDYSANYNSSYTGVVEYSMPLLYGVPPISTGQPTEISTGYLWLHQVLASANESQIQNFIFGLSYGDTLKFLSKLLYEGIDDNPLSFERYNASALAQVGRPPLPWNYKARPGPVRTLVQNQVGLTFPDSGRTGFLLACDIIADVKILDTIVRSNPGQITSDMVQVDSKLIEGIKGKIIPGIEGGLHTGIKRHTAQSSTLAVPQIAVETTASPDASLRFEYSPEWQRGEFTDNISASNSLEDSKGWWIKPSEEYIVFLSVEGVNKDRNNTYFTVKPLWGVFGNSGGMYPVRNGKVIDPFDDFGLGANLSVADWKTRLRVKIAAVLHP